MKTLLGGSPLSSIVGYALAGLLVLQQFLESGETNWTKIGIAVLVAVLGRVAADSSKVKP